MPVQYEKKNFANKFENIWQRETKGTTEIKNCHFCKLRDITLVSYKELYNQTGSEYFLMNFK